MPHHHGAGDHGRHHADGEREIPGRFQDEQRHRDGRADNARGNRAHAGKSKGNRVDLKPRRHSLKRCCCRGPEKRTQQERRAEQAAAHAGPYREGGSRDLREQQ